jgi:hypothetical protein
VITSSGEVQETSKPLGQTGSRQRPRKLNTWRWSSGTKEGKLGKRGVDLIGQMLGALVEAMDKRDADVLGDLYQGSITYGEAGQSVCS